MFLCASYLVISCHTRSNLIQLDPTIFKTFPCQNDIGVFSRMMLCRASYFESMFWDSTFCQSLCELAFVAVWNVDIDCEAIHALFCWSMVSKKQLHGVSTVDPSSGVFDPGDSDGERSSIPSESQSRGRIPQRCRSSQEHRAGRQEHRLGHRAHRLGHPGPLPAPLRVPRRVHHLEIASWHSCWIRRYPQITSPIHVGRSPGGLRKAKTEVTPLTLDIKIYQNIFYSLPPTSLALHIFGATLTPAKRNSMSRRLQLAIFACAKMYRKGAKRSEADHTKRRSHSAFSTEHYPKAQGRQDQK